VVCSCKHEVSAEVDTTPRHHTFRHLKLRTILPRNFGYRLFNDAVFYTTRRVFPSYQQYYSLLLSRNTLDEYISENRRYYVLRISLLYHRDPGSIPGQPIYYFSGVKVEAAAVLLRVLGFIPYLPFKQCRILEIYLTNFDAK
jgi:hypothetical protein